MNRAIVALLLLLIPVAFPLQARADMGGAAMGMGGAFSALAEGSQAVYWNPAGLASGPRFELAVTYTSPQDRLNYNSSTAVAARFGRWGLGINQITTAPWAGGELWNTIAGAYGVTQNLSLGGAYRHIEGISLYDREPYEYHAYDLAAQFKSGIFRGGIVLRDLNGPSETNAFLMTTVPCLSAETDHLTFASEWSFYRSRSYWTTTRSGIEYRPWGKEGALSVRTGVYDTHGTWGLGLKRDRVFLDLVSIPDWEAVQATAGIRF